MAAGRPRALSPDDEERFFTGLAYAGEFFAERAPVHRALQRLAGLLEESDVPYAIAGAMALNDLGYRHVTESIEILLTKEGLARFKRAHLGRGYVEKFAGSRGLRDTEHDVAIDVVLAGDFPGDGKPKPVVFPDPAAVTERGARMRFLPLEKVIELKLASGMTAPHRIRDLADALELVRAQRLERDFGQRLDPSVRAKFDELWVAAQVRDPE